MKTSEKELESLWSLHNAEWRHPAQIASQWDSAAATDPKLLKFRTKGDWWDVVAEAGITLIVTREYEHLLLAISSGSDGPEVSFMPMPHPSGLAIDRNKNTLYVASTRNPNQVYELAPVADITERLDVDIEAPETRPLVPVASRFLPGYLYMHDLAWIDGKLYANSVGQNAVVQLTGGSDHERVWWPKCIELDGKPVFGRNHIQLNSIAPAKDIKHSFFSASCDKISNRRPGHLNFPVDGRGVIFSGETREPICYGLTRPHSARLYSPQSKAGEDACAPVWVDNSGYGELGFVEDEQLSVVSKLPGWTRGLCFHKNIAFVGTSRVIPKFSKYAPGLDVEKSVCAIHAIDIKTGKTLGSLIWPFGNQIFAIDWLPVSVTRGFPFTQDINRLSEREKLLFYAFSLRS